MSKTFIKKEQIIIDNIHGPIVSFETWANECGYVFDKENNCAIDEEFDKTYTEEDFIETLTEIECNDFVEWLRHCDNPFDFVVTGQLGLWNRKPVIQPKVYQSLESAISDCIGNCYYYKVAICDKCISVDAVHHDGTNHFKIYMFNATAQKRYDNCSFINADDVLERICMNIKNFHTFYEEMFND